MDTERMIHELKRTADKHKNDKLLTFGTSITALCNDVIPKLESLRQYEAVGTLEECQEARERQQAKKAPTNSNFYACPKCGEIVSMRRKYSYCFECGQAIDWGSAYDE